ncbi:hypothetical protein ACFOHS_22755 [Jhaorihella thermophila]
MNERATAGLHRMVHDVFRASEKDRKAREYVLLLRSRKGADGQEHKQPLPLTLTPLPGIGWPQGSDCPAADAARTGPDRASRAQDGTDPRPRRGWRP